MKNLIQTLPLAAVLLSLPLRAGLAPESDLSIAGAGGYFFPTTGVAVGRQAVLLAIDEYLLPLRENVCYYLSTPSCRKEPVLTASRGNPMAPDQVTSHFYGTVLKEGGKFRMWYYAVRLKAPGDPLRPVPQDLLLGPVCYAESSDGIQWHKPNLGQVEIRGSRENNAISLPDGTIEGVHIIRDEADPNPQRRYKMVYNPHDGKTFVIRTATSPDGIHWTAAAAFGVDQFIETSSFYKFNGLYVVNGQRKTPSEGGAPSGRQGRAIISANFDQWIPGETGAFLLPEPADPLQRGSLRPYDQVHLGVGGASFGNVVVGLYGIWHNRPGDNDSQKRWGWFGYGKISCDLGLVVSNDGLHFREPVKGRIFIASKDAPSTPIPGKSYPTILTQSGNGILNVGDETRIYFGRWLNPRYGEGERGEVGLATLPRDRWGALGLYPESAPEHPAHGSVWSAPIRLPSARDTGIFLNADGADSMRVDVADGQFNLLPKFSGDNAGRPKPDHGFDCGAVFSNSDIGALRGRTIRLRIRLLRQAGAEPRLYAVYLRDR